MTLIADEEMLVVGKMLFTLLEYFFLYVSINIVLNANEQNGTVVGLARSDISYTFFTFNIAQFKCEHLALVQLHIVLI